MIIKLNLNAFRCVTHIQTFMHSTTSGWMLALCLFFWTVDEAQFVTIQQYSNSYRIPISLFNKILLKLLCTMLPQFWSREWTHLLPPADLELMCDIDFTFSLGSLSALMKQILLSPAAAVMTQCWESDSLTEHVMGAIWCHSQRLPQERMMKNTVNHFHNQGLVSISTPR